MQRRDSQHRFITPMLKNIFGKNFNVSNDFADRADDFIKFFSLHGAGPAQKKLFAHNSFSVCLLCMHALFVS